MNMDSGCRRPSGVTGLREAKAFGFDGAYPRAWRSRENAVRSAQAGLSRPHAEIDLLLSKELEETARQKALVGDPRLDSLSAEGPTFRWRTPKPGKMHFGSLAPQNSTPPEIGRRFYTPPRIAHIPMCPALALVPLHSR